MALTAPVYVLYVKQNNRIPAIYELAVEPQEQFYEGKLEGNRFNVLILSL